MQYPRDFSASTGAAPSATASTRRRHYRHKLGSLAYVNLNQANGGIVRDLSEAGLALQAVAPVKTGQQVHLRVELGPRLHLETVGRVAWTGTLGMTGIEFVAPGSRPRRLLQQWMFTQLLMRAQQTFSADSIFACDRNADQAPELHFSAARRQAIKLDPREMMREAKAVQIGWLPVSVSPRGLARLVDGLALAAAVLLFCVMTLAMVRAVPSWPIALCILLAAGGLLGGLYWLLFTLAMGGTPGSRLSGAYRANSRKREEEDQPRFR